MNERLKSMDERFQQTVKSSEKLKTQSIVFIYCLLHSIVTKLRYTSGFCSPQGFYVRFLYLRHYFDIPPTKTWINWSTWLVCALYSPASSLANREILPT
jgi:hypothetical protein